MTDMGFDFKAPPKANVEAWKILEALAQNGFTFNGCGCDVGFKPPKTLKEVPRWLEQHRTKSKGERLLEKIDRQAQSRRENRKAKAEAKPRPVRYPRP